MKRVQVGEWFIDIDEYPPGLACKFEIFMYYKTAGGMFYHTHEGDVFVDRNKKGAFDREELYLIRLEEDQAQRLAEILSAVGTVSPNTARVEGELREQMEEILAQQRLGYALSSGAPLFNKDDGVARSIDKETAGRLLHLIHQQRERWESAARTSELNMFMDVNAHTVTDTQGSYIARRYQQLHDETKGLAEADGKGEV